MLKETLADALLAIWPMLFIFTVILSSVRIAYLLSRRQKIVLYREFLTLAFIIYILTLFYIVTFQDGSMADSNFVPFKEIMRYDFGTDLFWQQTVGNILLFVPFGFFVSYYLKTKKLIPIFILSLITSLSIEITQNAIGRTVDIDDIILNVTGGIVGYYLFVGLDSINDKIPKFLKRDWMFNIMVIILMIIIVIYLFNLDTSIVGNFYE